MAAITRAWEGHPLNEAASLPVSAKSSANSLDRIQEAKEGP